MLDADRREGRSADRLLYGMNQLEQLWRCEHPMPALHSSLQDMGNSVHIFSRRDRILIRRGFRHLLDVFAQPLPDTHQLEIIGPQVAGQRHNGRRPFGQRNRQHSILSIPAGCGTGLHPGPDETAGWFASRPRRQN